MAGYGQFVGDLTPYANQLIQRATEDAAGFAARVSEDMIIEAVRAVHRATSQQLVQLADALERGPAPEDRAELHRRLAQRGQDAVLRSFDQTRGRSTTNAALNRASAGSKYRRYAGGRLRAALASSAFWSADADGFDFINVGLLNDRAAQWARVNFGAGPEGGGSLPPRSVRLGAMVIASLGLEEDARPSFRMPTGYFTDSSGQPVSTRTAGAAFFPAMTGPLRRGTEGGGRTYKDGEGNVQRIPMVRARMVGVRGRGFLDAGVTAIANDLGPGYQELYRKLFAQAETNVRPYRLVSRVSTTRAGAGRRR